ncbi:MAG: hypothetical protein WD397_05580 [Wenzhouxiangellaceae bacterium]
MSSVKIYQQGVPSRRAGPIYNAVPYPTKIDPEAIAVFIAAHTKPGDRVLDVFGGSCTTGMAVCLCDTPTERMKALSKELGIDAEWGSREAVVYELSPVGCLTGSVMCSPPDPLEFQAATDRILTRANEALGWMYQAHSPSGAPGEIRHVIWSDVLQTPCCSHEISLWDAVARRAPARIHKKFACPVCGTDVKVKDCARVTVRRMDRKAGKSIRVRKRLPVQLYGISNGRTWKRSVTDKDRSIIRNCGRRKLDWVPDGLIQWGDLYRRGYHTGINKFSDLYTPRNLRVIARLWAEIDKEPEHLKNALKLLVLSYNAAHSTLLTRIVAKKEQPDFVVSGAQSGVLYVSGLPVEKNIVRGLKRKAKVFSDAFSMLRPSASKVNIICGSSTDMRLERSSIDYVFTDPPFGDYIPYAEINQLNEAWLGSFTDKSEEAIVSRAQGKGVSEYEDLLNRVFSEVRRVLKPSACATVIFHSSKAEIWRAVGRAFSTNDLRVKATSILDKLQVSFKQVVAEAGTRHDAVFLLINDKEAPASIDHLTEFTAIPPVEVSALSANALAEMDKKMAYSHYVSTQIQHGLDVESDAKAFYSLLHSAKCAGEV